MEKLERKVQIMYPVRKMTSDERKFMDDYAAGLRAAGHHVHYPPDSVNQNDPTGYYICLAHCEAMKGTDEVHAFWNPASEGSVFDFGMLFMAKKPLFIINEKEIQPTPNKSYTNVLLKYAQEWRGYKFAKPK